MRPAEVHVVTGDITKAKNELGWQPRVGFSDLVKLMVDSDLSLERSRL
jgi:GDPmannose 4,6-dehydratase